MNTRLITFFITLPFGVSLQNLAAEDSGAASPAFIRRLVREAEASHPSVQAAAARSQAAASAIGAIRLWEDPQLGLGTLFASNVNRQGNGDISVGIDQMLPRRGLYRAEKSRALAEQQAQQAMQKQTANELGLMVAQAALELALADEVIRLQAENVAWLETIVKTAEERAKNPDATGTETLRLESELSVKKQTLASARRQRTQFATTLNLLLGRPADATWSALSLPPKAQDHASATALKVRLERDNPQLAALRHQTEAAQAESTAAREKRKPAFSVGLQVNTYSQGTLQDTMAMLNFKMTLPWFNRAAYKSDIARADKLHEAAQSDLAAQQRLLYSQLSAFITEARNGQQLVNAYVSEVIPKSEKTVETLQNAWISSKATLLEVLDARRALLEAHMEHERALAAWQVALQNLAALTGGFTQTTHP
ncbi:TolC family protein [Prosthecobacter sp.]|uniref:TolC family protein n=1 Tax=Prosthecobacter sp. TaxID=1965333 RepID=UPI002488CF37|nr:TolC family protein [Prosthecobacter sp.]MDI1310537.1 TolC family protein [Prosthecobacter sp.]